MNRPCILVVAAQQATKQIAALRAVIAAYQRGDAELAAEIFASLEGEA